MVCIYCAGRTRVVNSRLQKRLNKVWRRRRCLKCQAVFSSIEQNVYDYSLAVKDRESHIIPFQRDQLFLSIYDACKHRKSAASDAAALTETALSKLTTRTENGIITYETIITSTSSILKKFDKAAHSYYTAYHPI